MEKSFDEHLHGHPALSDTDFVADNYRRILDDINNACLTVGRKADEVTLLGVTKTVDAPRINRVIQEGLTHIGENRVQEFLGKRSFLHLDGVNTHLIGPLQTNKVPKIVGEVDMIESIDSIRLAQAVAAAAQRAGVTMDVLVEVNIGGEASKSGVSPDMLEDLLWQIGLLPGLHIKGLMTILPILDDDREKRRFFSQMYKLFIDIKSKSIDNINMSVLSMGMSADYVQAIQEGATLIRVGSALFGKRTY